MLPDRTAWLSVWMNRLANGSLKRLISILAFKEPLAMLSCFACVLGDQALADLDMRAIEDNLKPIRRTRNHMRESYDWAGSPVLVVNKALGNSQDG